MHLGARRSRQSPDDKAKEDEKEKVGAGRVKPMVVQIDFCYTFTKKDEKAAAEEEEKERAEQDDGGGVNLGEPFPPPDKKVPDYLLHFTWWQLTLRLGGSWPFLLRQRGQHP